MARQSDLSVGIPVLLTRPETEAQAFASALSARFGNRVRPLVAPLMAPCYLTPEVPPTDFAAVVFTSAQGVEGARRLGAALPHQAFCVGRKTAAAATAAGFSALSADGDADALLSLILNQRPKDPILYLRGVDTTGDLEKNLSDQGITTVSLQVYRQDFEPFSPEAQRLLCTPGPVILPLFSPRSARLFRQAMPPDAAATLHIAAMSSAVAQALDGLPRSALIIAAHPDALGMLDAVESLLARLPAP